MNQALRLKTSEIHTNLKHFLEVLPSLVEAHEGQYALLRHGKVVAFFDTAVDAQIAGNQRYDDQLFSIQIVQKAAEELGYFSYALHSR
jgi:hypothetical protein